MIKQLLNSVFVSYEELCFLPYKLIFLCLVKLNGGGGGGGGGAEAQVFH